jgi:hypothetical protein
MVAAGPAVWVQVTTSLAYRGKLPAKTTDVRPSQYTGLAGLITDAVTLPTGAGTVIITSSVPETQLPLTVQRNVYTPCIRFEIAVLFCDGLLMVGILGPFMIVHIPVCPAILFPSNEPARFVF